MSTVLTCDGCGEPITPDQASINCMVQYRGSSNQSTGGATTPGLPIPGGPLGTLVLDYHYEHAPPGLVDGGLGGPTLTTLEPSSVPQAGQVSVKAKGANFTDAAKVVFNGVELATAYRGSLELEFSVNAVPGGHPAGTFDVFVRQGDYKTTSLPFTIEESV